MGFSMLTRSIAKLKLVTPSSKSSLVLGNLVPVKPWLLTLPQEMFNHLMSYLPLADCGQLCLTSKLVRDRVTVWVTSEASIVQLTRRISGSQDPEARLEQWLGLCRLWGIFLKRATMLLPTRARLGQLSAWFPGLQLQGEADFPPCWTRVSGRMGLAVVLHTLCQGWEKEEYETILDWLLSKFTLLSRLRSSHRRSIAPSIIFGTPPSTPTGQNTLSEVREILRIFCWHYSYPSSSGSWLQTIMARFASYNSQSSTNFFCASSLLFFLLGCTHPLHSVTSLSFEEATIRQLRASPEPFLMEVDHFSESYWEAKHHFGELGRALRTLEATTDPGSLQNLMATLFQGWDKDNQAACLLFSSHNVLLNYLTELLNRDAFWGVKQLATLLVALVVVCGKLENSINQGLDKILDIALGQLLKTPTQKRQLITDFWNEIGMRLGDVLSNNLMELGLHMGHMALMKNTSAK